MKAAEEQHHLHFMFVVPTHIVGFKQFAEDHILRKCNEEMPVASLISSLFLKSCCLPKVQQGQGGKEEVYNIKLTPAPDNQRLQSVLESKKL